MSFTEQVEYDGIKYEVEFIYFRILTYNKIIVLIDKNGSKIDHIGIISKILKVQDFEQIGYREVSKTISEPGGDNIWTIYYGIETKKL